MLRHNLLLIYRHFKRFKGTFFINLIGLTTGLAAAMLIALWVADELSVDKFHEKNDRLFQVMENDATTGTIKTSAHTTDFLADALALEMPEVAYAAVVTPPDFFPTFTLSTSAQHIKGNGRFADDNFFKMFSYDLVAGNATQVLADKNSVVVSQSLAKSLFHSADEALGKSISWEVMNLKKEVSISGIFKDLPQNATDQFNFVLPFEAFKDLMGPSPDAVNWDASAPFHTYLLLKENADPEKLNDKLHVFLETKSKSASARKLFLRPNGDNYLYGDYENGIVSGGRIVYVKLFTAIAVFILIIACINFVNLSTARTFRRMREVGIKKAIGAQRSTLVFQYFGEAFVMAFLSLMLALGIVHLLLPAFSNATGKDIAVHFSGTVIVVLFGLVLFTALAAGGYPALYLSRFNPAKVLKGQLRTSAAEDWTRKGLVVFQFALTVIFIVGVLVIYKQIEFIQTKNLGFDKANVIAIEADGNVAVHADAFIAEVKKIDGVSGASSMLGGIVSRVNRSEGGGMPGTLEWEGKTFTLNSASVNYDLLELLGLELIAGRTFNREFPSDTDKVIYNEAAIEAIGLQDPVGKIIGGREIIGIVKNFHYQSMHEPIKPHFFHLEPQAASAIMIRMEPGMTVTALEGLDHFYKAFNPGYEFSYRFLDDDYETQYAAERRVGLLSQYFAGIAIIISCLGLFGLAAFTAERRTKEIGIRKVLGSRQTDIVFLLSLDFTRMIIIAIVIALPLSYLGVSSWLDNFAYRIELKAWFFICAGGATLLIAWLTVAIQTLRASRINPAITLRSE